MEIRRPNWLPDYIPELQGLRGIAILAVVVYHCHPRLEGTPFHGPALWGWAGVNLFFVLSGFLITSILLEAREAPHYFRNFYGRRALRIWPVYALVLLVCLAFPDWFLSEDLSGLHGPGPWLACLLLLQNLFHFALPSAIGPMWSLAIEEQYYFVWAPLVRWLRRPWMLAAMLALAMTASPALRLSHFPWLTRTHTQMHLDGIAWGSLLALALHTLGLSQRAWLWLGLGGMLAGFAAAGTIAGGTAFLDSALAVGFAGAVVAAIASTGRPVNALLRRGPLPFLGRISYGLYMTHIFVFIYFGWFDLRMNAFGVAGNLAVVAVRLLASTLVATALWYGFESRILRLKRVFVGRGFRV